MRIDDDGDDDVGDTKVIPLDRTKTEMLIIMKTSGCRA